MSSCGNERDELGMMSVMRPWGGRGDDDLEQRAFLVIAGRGAHSSKLLEH